MFETLGLITVFIFLRVSAERSDFADEKAGQQPFEVVRTFSVAFTLLPALGGARFSFTAFDFLNFVFNMVVEGGAVEGRLGVGGGEWRTYLEYKLLYVLGQELQRLT